MEDKNQRQQIVSTLKTKSILKQDVYDLTLSSFELFKRVFRELTEDLSKQVTKEDQRVKVEFTEKGQFEAVLKVAGDVLMFNMHTNIFDFDNSHAVWKTSYVQEDNGRAYCGMITVYNFLSDSIKYNRINDVGYLIARIFINKDGHFMVEGKKKLGFLFNDFAKSKLDKEQVVSIVEAIVIYCLEFDLLTPPFEAVKQVTVSEMLELSSNMHVKTGKRVGFKSQADEE